MTNSNCLEIAQIVSGFAAAFAAILAAVGLFFQAFSIRQSKRTMEAQLFESLFRDIRDLERELGVIPDEDEDERLKWRNRFLQTLEFFCFLVHEEYLSRASVVEYFKDAVVNWHDTVFLPDASQDEKHRPDIYPEFKRFVREASRKNL